MAIEEVTMTLAKHGSVIEVVLCLFGLTRNSVLLETEAGVSAILVRVLGHLGTLFISFPLHFERFWVDLKTPFETCTESWIIFRVNLSLCPSFLSFGVNNTELFVGVYWPKTKLRVRISLPVRIVWRSLRPHAHLAISVRFCHLRRRHHAWLNLG